MKHFKAIATATAVLISNTVFAQDTDSYHLIHTFDTDFASSGDFTMQYEDTDLGDLSVSTAGFTVATKMRNKAQTTHAFSLQYSGLFFDIQNEEALALPDQLNSFELNYRTSYVIDSKWGLFGSISGAWNGSGTSFDSDGFSVGLWVGAMYSLNESTNFFFGGAYDSLADQHFMPGMGVEWKIDDSWTMSLGFPKTALTYNVSERLRYSFLVEGNFGTYFVEAEDLNPSFAGLGDRKLEYKDYRVALKADWDITEKVSISGKLGYLIKSELDYFEDGYKVESDDGAVYMELGLRTRF